MSISERIFVLLKEQNKTQTALANAIGIRVATVSAWKAQNTDPSANILANIAVFFGVSVDYLCTGKESDATAAAINQGIFGDRNQNNTVTIHGNGTVEISEFDGELIKVCGRLDMRRKNALLSYAYDLENETVSENKNLNNVSDCKGKPFEVIEYDEALKMFNNGIITREELELKKQKARRKLGFND